MANDYIGRTDAQVLQWMQTFSGGISSGTSNGDRNIKRDSPRTQSGYGVRPPIFGA